ncbi:DUF2971 domain-containing protein [Pseudomonas benzenivorans]|uniref:DUF2971 domain-containing protein n=1 Tax=Pseudomonas benzenivorans TaxID=556533 RepID=A0ABY5HB69_9PSED|nr:DUF2971 domain-containing protein [Pseudomonas benzenivorans]UTW09324.1 DUF2971 domain-containing protein [Pseudomonas benzenivorans]
MTSVFKYRGGDWATVKRDLRSLSRNELYAAPFASLNDPFESVVVIDRNSFEIGGLVLGWAAGGKLDQGKKASSKLEDALGEFVKFTRGIGIYSLSKSATDELLWAHYANSHQGFCVEFDLENLLDYKLEAEEILSVDYSLRPPTLSMVELMASQKSQGKLLQKLVATKSRRWNYEEEIRVCVGNPGLKEYDFRALRAIYFGARCSYRLIRLAMRLLRGRGISYYQMQLVSESYNLEAIAIDDEFPNAAPYRERLAPVDDGIPYLDEKTKPFQKELSVAIEMARREPYCERVRDAYLSGSKGTPENPVFYVTYDRSDGLPRNVFYSLQEIRRHVLYA